MSSYPLPFFMLHSEDIDCNNTSFQHSCPHESDQDLQLSYHMCSHYLFARADDYLISVIDCYKVGITNFIQLVSPQPVDRFLQTKLRWKAPNKGHPHICGMYKSDNKWLRYQTISSYKSFICKYLMNGWTDLHNWTCVGKCLSIYSQWYIMCLKAISISRDTSISM